MRVALWSVTDGVPVRLEQGHSFVEADLEQWVERDATLVLDGLRWIGRQVTLPDRSRVDLVGLTREGQLVVAELKMGILDTATLSQALHYALWLGAMDIDSLQARLTLDEEALSLLTESITGGVLDISILLIGTARQPELDQAAAFLSDRGFDVPVRMVTFTPFLDATGGVFLAREVEEHEQEPDEESPKARSSRAAKIEWVQERARQFGVGDVVDDHMAAAAKLGLRVKPWPKSITIVPPFTRGRTLVYVSPVRAETLHWGYSTENLAELYGADPKHVEAALGANWTDIDPTTARTRLAAFVDLMSTLQATATLTDGSVTTAEEPTP